MSRLEAGLESSQMPYPAAIGFKFLFGELGYRFVKFTEYRSFVVGQCSGDWYRIGNMMSEQVDPDIQSINECPHLQQPLNLRLLGICAVQYLLIKL